MTTPKAINCPTCSSATVWSKENPSRPFCSERCRLIDLGAWLDEKNIIPGEPVISPQSETDYDNYH
jgi:endogenous inhibitor of DNA gyrase (YacG/DUF329 family)